MTTLKRVLIANRGEIAIRIARAAASLGMESVAVYSKPDAQALHTRQATVSLPLTGNDPIGAYLNIDELVQLAVDNGCDCVHPGYGFLSENAAFAEALKDRGVVFIGPSPATLSLFGDKVSAKALATELGIPVITGQALSSAKDAESAAQEIGYPVMLKAAAGGGGRGMRAVLDPNEIQEAYARCASEAEKAFGDGAVFVEKLIQRPRHIEVQVLADSAGHAIHLRERDCSIQQRNQKVVEIAPAPNLDEALRDKMLADALKLTEAAKYVNAGTVEFLVEPETGDYYFIECNPRIQVEHTITEQVMGIDLVASQFQIAAGATLAELGLDQTITPRGYAIQARVVAQGIGTLTAYKEPSGIGIRVDAHGYAGYAPPPQFDPLLAKLICHVPTGSYSSAVDATRRAIAEFHIAGLSTNLGQLHGILGHAVVRDGDARTSFLAEVTDLDSGKVSSNALHLLEQQAKTITGTANVATPGAGSVVKGLDVTEGDQGMECPMAGTVVALNVGEGDTVSVGDPLVIISAMKMETAVTASCTGKISSVQPLNEGDAVSPGEVLVTITPSQDASEQDALDPENSWVPTLNEVATLQRLAAERLAPDSEEPGVVRQRSRGKLTCRERIDLVLDNDTFREIGSIAGFASYDWEGNIDAFTPANHVGGWGEIEARTTIVCADDFTSRGGHADGAIGAKSLYLDRLATEMRIPSVRLLDGSSGGGSVAAMVPQQKADGESGAKESSGAIKAGRPRVSGSGGSFLPGHLGSGQYTQQLNTVPVVNMLLGSVVGIGAAKAVLGHFSVMVREISQLFVAGPPVVSHAMGYDITKEDLGGWHIHCTNGSVDNLAETEQDAIAMTRQFLSYLPSSVYDTPPVVSCSDPTDRSEEELLTIIPRKRTSTFDVRKTLRLMADKDSFFEIGSLWGTDQVTGFVRFNGHPLGIIASDSRHANGGALTADGCDKLKRHIDLCDVFHIPILNLVDNPGFAVGLEHEIASTIRKGGEWMVAFAQIKVPIFTVIMRRSFGVADNNYATPLSRPAMRVVWPAADVGGIPPEGGIEAAYKRQLAEAEDPVALRAELDARIESARGPVGPLNKFQMEEMIDPRHTRQMICDWATTAYKIIAQPGRLGPRALEFRP
ncbi:MAG: ATP-grasp domain-containing protein [Pseudomonadales bacterium]|nr:ATP-grasp domain-containing protein [Pseudomonadales bacterium]